MEKTYCVKFPSKGNLPKIALVLDTDYWAFANIAKQLYHYLNDRFSFVILSMNKIKSIIQLLLMVQGCDVVHFFWREDLRLIESYLLNQNLSALEKKGRSIIEKAILSHFFSMSVYDHLYLKENEINERQFLFQKIVDSYYVSSQRLLKIYNQIETYPNPSTFLEDGVDLTLFYPLHLERFNNIANRPIVIGWAGHSCWGGFETTIEDFKGMNTILQPALKQLSTEGLPIRMLFADRAKIFIPHAEMVNYYSNIDLYVCTSKIEGTPNPILEAMACGVPVISTDVGIVPQILGPKQSEFILTERSVQSLKRAIRRFIEHPALFQELSQENLAHIQKQSWSLKAEGFADYFQRCLVDSAPLKSNNSRIAKLEAIRNARLQ
jgi:glycosyltransferase involved in cell wall biosynthesis